MTTVDRCQQDQSTGASSISCIQKISHSFVAGTGLHEAAAVLRNETIKREEDRLAEYIVRLQTHSTEHPELDGAFFRAWDFAKWEVWASDADIGW